MKNKIAEITLFFWILKILATTLGETTGDFLAHTLGLGYAVGLAITGGAFLVLLALQIGAKTFHAAAFWAAVIGATTLGTEISDFMDRSLGLGYAGGSLILVALLAGILGIWYAKEKNISVRPITHRATEILFWAAVLLSNSLGTAFGDYLTDNAGLTYAQGALAASAAIGAVLLLHYATRINQALLFWAAFIFTRPFGATFGDLLTKTHAQGGLDFGTAEASLATVGLFIAVLAVAEMRGRRGALREA